MKKITASILMLLFLFGLGTVAYGETTGNNADNVGQRRAAIQAKMQNMADLKAEVQPQITEIRQNRTETLQLRAELRETYKAAVQHIKALKSNPDQLTEAQIAQLKQSKETLKQIKLDLAASKGDVRTEVQALKAARQQKDIDKIKAGLDNIITIQHDRITLIENAVAELKKILEI